ncbi:hypothetical protein HJC23_002170 [Cyclotella cryptica]|uniref:PDZ domain-containing protein n=1 Tax=Cyclotella cryptica TaxID=29204 RepID=A0ABD3Q7M2_9STRA|eukprot:CCRYP_008197-RB/>CCRYP_008197-RB protein AED:0.04 eAED:0.04 QI:218/1/1/1/0.33/0.25/4/1648/438
MPEDCDGGFTLESAAVAPVDRNRKLIKIKVWDENDPNSEPSIISVEVSLSTQRQESMDLQDPLASASFGLGEVVQIRQHDQGARGHSLPVVELWQSPRVSDSIHAVQTAQLAHEEPTPPPQSDENDAYNTDTEKSKSLEPFVIPSVVCATIVKRTPDQKVGLAFRKAKGVIVLEKISAGSPFDGSELRPGQECLCINDHRVRSARRAAEIVRETTTSLTLLVSDGPRPPGTMYTVIHLGGEKTSGDEAAGGDVNSASAAGMYFELNHGLVQLTKLDAISPVLNSSIKVGDFILSINGIVTGTVQSTIRLLSDPSVGMVPILYFNMRQLRVSLVDKVIGDAWKREWSDTYDECVVLPPTGKANPLTLRFRENGTCELVNPLRAFRVLKRGKRDKTVEGDTSIPSDHPLHSVVSTLNSGITCVLDAIRRGVDQQQDRRKD